MPTGEGEAPMVLLDQWHVDLLVPAGMDDDAGEPMRHQVDASLRQWAVGTQLRPTGTFLRVEQ